MTTIETAAPAEARAETNTKGTQGFAGAVTGIFNLQSRWFDKSSNIADLMRWLVERGDLLPSSFEDLCAIVDQPWRWSGEYEAMRDAQRERNETCSL